MRLFLRLKKMVTFTCLSLVEMSAISNANTMDIIFCRNVLMYFTNEWINKISKTCFIPCRKMVGLWSLPVNSLPGYFHNLHRLIFPEQFCTERPKMDLPILCPP